MPELCQINRPEYRRIRDAWRNEQQAQQQQDVEEEERFYRQREEARRDVRLKKITNNTSRQAIATYQAQRNDDADDDFYVDPSAPAPAPALPSPSPSPPPPPPPGNAGGLPRDSVQRHSLGPMNLQCSYCHALHFSVKKLSKSTIREPKFGMCYLSGQVDLPPFPPAPRDLRDLCDGTSPHSLDFKKIFASTMQHLHSPLWELMLIVWSSIGLALIHLESMGNFIILQAPSFLFLTRLLFLSPRSISMIHSSSWVYDSKRKV